jgi:signal transduction histidine kinase
MSHELRTPLNAILGYTELILDKLYGDTPEKMRGVLERIETNGRHFLGLINDVLDMSKIEAGQLVLALADYSLKSVVETVYTAVEPLAKEKNLSFKIEVLSDLPAGHGDERRLTQVLLNLVGNAIKFTDKGEVAIKASVGDGSFTVTVRAPAFPQLIRPNYSRNFNRPTLRSRARRVAPDWGLRSQSELLRCTVEKSGLSCMWGRARPFPSPSRSWLSNKRGPHEQAHSCGRRSTGQSADRARFANGQRLRDD